MWNDRKRLTEVLEADLGDIDAVDLQNVGRIGVYNGFWDFLLGTFVGYPEISPVDERTVIGVVNLFQLFARYALSGMAQRRTGTA